MKKLFALPMAAFVFAACSESTAPESAADISARYAKPVKPPTTTPATGTDYTATFNFNGEIEASANVGFGTDTDDGSSATSANNLHFAPSDPTNGFIGRFNNTATRVIITVANPGSKYTLNFDLYIIGSWDGRGKQAQSGVFEANVFQVGWRCNPGQAVTPLFTTSFSNQLTVQQDYPLPYLQGGNKAATGSFAQDALGYKTRPDLSHYVTFRAFGDVSYKQSYTVGNVCNGAGPQFVLSSTAPGQQNNFDESWGIDNVVLKVDN